MSFRFRRSFKIAPGLRLNLGKRGVSMSAGVRGAHVTVGPRGVTKSVGIPGTGLSFTSRQGRSTRGRFRPSAPIKFSTTEPVIAADRFGIVAEPIPTSSGRVRTTLFIAGGVSLWAAFLVPSPYGPVATVSALVLFVIGSRFQSRDALERAEQARVQNVARAELNRRLEQFATAVGTLTTTDQRLTAERVRGVLAKQQTLGLTDPEVATFRTDVLQAIAELLDFEAGCGGHLPPIVGHEVLVSPDVCYFSGAAVYDKRGDHDSCGTLHLTNARAIFASGDGLVTTPWTKVVTATRNGRTVSIQRRDRQTPYLFVLTDYAEAIKVDFIARNVLATRSGAVTIGAIEIVSEDLRCQPNVSVNASACISEALSAILFGQSS
jgi:hypothetical protein